MAEYSRGGCAHVNEQVAFRDFPVKGILDESVAAAENGTPFPLLDVALT
jgi:hypothetical protein